MLFIKRVNRLWNIESSIENINDDLINLESKAQGYRKVRKIIKEYEKTLL